MAWSIVLGLSLLLANTLCNFDYHLDKGSNQLTPAKDFFMGQGISFKYPSNLMILSKKLTKKQGLLTTAYSLISEYEWNMFMTVRFDGMFEGPNDGIVINWAENSKKTIVSSYDANEPADLGFPNIISGLVIIIRKSEESVPDPDYRMNSLLQTILICTSVILSQEANLVLKGKLENHIPKVTRSIRPNSS